MPTYITLGNWTDQGVRTVKDAGKRIDAAKQMIKGAGGEMKAFYMTMGAYDLVTIVDAPDDEAVAKLLLTIGGLGNVRTTTLRAFSEAETRKIIGSLG
ncbi:MAG TPA: GYD domain-containing protein [Candidatus Limnocylindria bacterium]|nr:GYD domain-containing protein [Candidatus Limnocylindria bacterium]